MDIQTIRELINRITVRLKTMDRKKLYISSIVALVVIVVSIFMLGKKDAGYADISREQEPIAVTAVTVEPEIIDAVVSAAGALNSKNVSLLSSKVMGKVSYLSVQEGDYVGQGKLIMKIDSGEIAAQAYQAQAAYNNAKLQYNRIKTLYDEKASTQMEMDQATLGLETAEAGLKAATAMESYTIITAPISGQVVEKKINLGEMALPGQPLLKLEDNRNLRLEVTVNEQDLQAVQPGAAVRVQIDAMPEKIINVRVGQVVPAADIRTHSFVAKIDIPAQKGLITGMYGKAFFPAGKRQVILVPRSTVVTMSGISGVYIVSPEGNAVFQMVQLGEVHGERIETLTGLKAGDRVIISKQEARIEGRKVILAENGK